MANNKKPSPQQYEEPVEKNAKKLLKRERHLIEQLRDAQEEQAEALRRFQRAEARLLKRTAHIQRIAARLMGIRQQLETIAAPSSTTVTELGGAAAPPPASAAGPVSAEGEAPVEHVASLDVAAHAGEIGAVEEEVPPEVPTLVEAQAADQLRAATLDMAASATGSAVSMEPEVPQGTPAPEVQTAEQTPETVEGVVDVFVSGIKDDEGTVFIEVQAIDQTHTVAVPQEAALQDEQAVSLTSAEADDLAREARAVAEAAEEEARFAAERASDAAARLDQMGSARHLLQELAELEAEAVSTRALADEAERVAREAEQRAAAVRGISPKEAVVEPATSPVAVTRSEEEVQTVLPIEEHAEELQAVSFAQEMPNDEVEQPVAPIGEALGGEEERRTVVEHPTTAESERAEELDEEEELLESIAARMVADAAAAAAAEAEALAEASSARTREARRLARQADQALSQVRAAIQNGALTGEETESALYEAEREATRAHAALADAEAAEERALSAAINAEAEAEVAEGMALAANEQSSHSNIRGEDPFDLVSNEDFALEDALDEDDTEERPAVRPQEPA